MLYTSTYTYAFLLPLLEFIRYHFLSPLVQFIYRAKRGIHRLSSIDIIEEYHLFSSMLRKKLLAHFSYRVSSPLFYVILRSG